MRCYNPDDLTIAFDDERLVADAGLLLPATLAVGLGLRELLDTHWPWQWRWEFALARLRCIPHPI